MSSLAAGQKDQDQHPVRVFVTCDDAQELTRCTIALQAMGAATVGRQNIDVGCSDGPADESGESGG
jgi:hypothetical protein